MAFEYNITGFYYFLDDIKEYQKIVELKLLDDRTKKHENFEDYLEEKHIDAVELSEDSINEYQLVKMFGNHSAFYTNSFRNSMLVQIFSVFENEIKNLCNEYYRLNKSDYKLKDLKGNSDIEKAKIFLVKTCKVEFSKLNEEWKYILKIKSIRNRIIHHQSSISRLDNDWKLLCDFFLEKYDKISFVNPYIDFEDITDDTEYRFHMKNENLTLEFIEVLKLYFNKLLIEINKSI